MPADSTRRRESLVYLNVHDPLSKRMLLQTALRLFAERGIHAVTVRDIAKDAGYTNPALFKFFDSKDSLVLFLFEHCYLNLCRKLETGAPPTLRFAERLRGIVEVFLDQFDDDPASVLFVQEHLRELWPRVSRKVRAHSIVGLIRQMLEAGKAEGSVGPDSDLDLLGAAIIGTLAQFARLKYFGEFKKPVIDYAPEIVKILCRITAK
jgi:AcrR family transcriptional regulator